jgi:hypothetical protein
MQRAAGLASSLRRLLRQVWAVMLLPLISILLALVVGALVILASQLVVPDKPFDVTLPITAYLASLL